MEVVAVLSITGYTEKAEADLLMDAGENSIDHFVL